MWDYVKEIEEKAHQPELEPKSKTSAEILKEYAEALTTKTDGKLQGHVTISVGEYTDEIVYAFYIVIPTKDNYLYRAIEVTQPNQNDPFDLIVRLFATNPRNNKNSNCKTENELKEVIEGYIDSNEMRDIVFYLFKIQNAEKE